MNLQPWNNSAQISLKCLSGLGCKLKDYSLIMVLILMPFPDGSGVIDPSCHLSTSHHHAEAVIAISLTDEEGVSYLPRHQSLCKS